MKRCSVEGCTLKHHARSLCNRHYNKWLKYGDPLHGKTYRPNKRPHSEIRPAAALKTETFVERTPLKPRIPGVNNVSYQLNFPIIQKLYIEAAKACHEPIYKGLNGAALENILLLCIKLAGCQNASPGLINELLEDLRTWAGCRDKIRFLKTLETWQDKEEEFLERNTKQMSLFSVK